MPVNRRGTAYHVGVELEDRAQLTAVAHDLRLAVVSLARRLRSERHPDNVGPLASSVLIGLYRSAPQTPGGLAEALNTAPQTLTRVLATLESRQLISRQVDPADGRQSLLNLTDEGRRLLKRDGDVRDAWLAAEMLVHLNPTERELLRIVSPLIDRLARDSSPASADEKATVSEKS